jgi:hypothetical protein
MVASSSVAVAWLLVLTLLVFIIFGAITNLQPGAVLLPALLIWLGFLAVLALTYLSISLRIRCPRCGYKFLKNPKGLGPMNFVYHPTLPKLPGINRWAYQIGRFLGTRRMRCISCGEELFP